LYLIKYDQEISSFYFPSKLILNDCIWHRIKCKREALNFIFFSASKNQQQKLLTHIFHLSLFAASYCTDTRHNQFIKNTLATDIFKMADEAEQVNALN
jgi:hypothetical protein